MTAARQRLALALLLSGAAHALLVGLAGPLTWPQPAHQASGPLSLHLLIPGPTDETATAARAAAPIVPVAQPERPERTQQRARTDPVPPRKAVGTPAPQEAGPAAAAAAPVSSESSASTTLAAPKAGETAADGPAAPPAQATGPTPEARQAVRVRLEQELARHFHYPLLARRRGWEGEVRLGLRIDPEGRVGAAQIIRGSGHELLDRAALEAIGKVLHLHGVTAWLSGHDLQLELPVIYRLTEG